jgi:hypothetical protein
MILILILIHSTDTSLLLLQAREFHSAGVRLFKEKRHLDSFHMFNRAYRLAVLG